MARVKVQGLDKINSRIKFLIKTKALDASFLSIIGNFVVERIRSFTRSGFSIAEGEPKKFDKLAPMTIRLRRETEREGRADSRFFKADRSNLTETGQLMKSLNFTVDQNKLEVEVRVSGRRNDGLSNKEVAERVKEGGRPFIGIDPKGMKVIRKLVVDELRRNLRLK